ncbi:AraC family transcriptional regulator [Emticicia agri]|uniref:AraC family transcriptional regulator n=1 Tax=Emticicia agri TaxID=2492393 RepID=A0A4Q5LT55_9BACT|nr:helix-turn-helix transcriptional regulator [Emticicia agri]RYU92609.1 AraC family transcriptional regulator [Emticicia agri]
MPKNNQIKTYNAESYRNNFIKHEDKSGTILKTDFDKFFIVRVEELIRLMKLPVPPARTNTHTFIYLTDGEAIMRIGSETYKIEKDECLVVAAGQVFSFDNIDINKGYLFNFHDDLMIGKLAKNDLLKDFEFLRVWGNPKISLDTQTSGFVRQLLERILIDYEINGLHNRELIQSYLIALLCEINRGYKPMPGITQLKAIAISNKFRELLFIHIKTKHLVSDYASLLNITANHLNKSVKAITGKSPTKWIDETIVLEAKILLYQSNLSISEIAAEVGLFDQSYFSRLFKKYEGTTPLQFRKLIEELRPGN